MNLPRCFALVLSACLPLLQGACSSVPSPQHGAAWPGKPFHSVRAFVYDCDADATVSFFQEGGRMAKGVINEPGALLNPGQVRRLQEAATTPPQNPKRRMACYIPHHAFVFYDSAEKPLATLEICFTCNRHVAYPSGKGLPTHIDMPALWALVNELNVPAGPSVEYYKDLYRRKCAAERN